MTTKKDIPLDLLKAIEAIAQPNLDVIQLKREDNTFYSFIENDTNSKNYFKIFIDGSKRIGSYDKRNFAYEWKPADATRATHHLHQGNIQDVIVQFEAWIKIIREIYETPSVHDDNFVKHYWDFYFNEFKIVDEDAYTSPFNQDQQDQIELYLDSLTQAIKTSGEKIDDTTKAELLSEIKEVKLALSTSTKTQVIKGITKVFAKLYKGSKTFAKEIVTEARKNLIKKLVELGIEYGPKILEALAKGY